MQVHSRAAGSDLAIRRFKRLAPGCAAAALGAYLTACAAAPARSIDPVVLAGSTPIGMAPTREPVQEPPQESPPQDPPPQDPPPQGDTGIQPAKITLHQNREYSVSERSYLLSAFRPTYFVATHNSEWDPSIYENVLGEDAVGTEEAEVKFQISLKFPIWQNAFGPSNDLYFAYTQIAFWQVFTDSSALSKPFRETNYEPELFFRHYGGPSVPWGGEIAGWDVGINHQSNGRAEDLSRSWNRVIGRAAIDYGDLAFLGRLWWRLPESDEVDENPNEYQYLGYGDVRAVWAPDKNTWTAMLRPATESVTFELTWSRKVSDALRVYVQWYNGYAENLYEYNVRSNRIGIGVAITDFLVGTD